MLRMNILQSLARDMCVDLRCRNVRMPEQQLHHTQIGAMVQQMRRERMPQRMRRQRRVDAGADRVFLDQRPEHLARHRAAEAGHEQCIR